ncbi:MAG: hypothetical protein H7338_05945 [Candidatus Sericytochromatia bacterium]|nr:hypothetical protein [Candidatus Sericytochromatia bacterium]
MATEISTLQSLKAVDAWIGVINSNINGGVRTAFKASRLKFGGSTTEIQRPGDLRSTPLQFPEPSLTTVNTVIDFSQGAVIGSSENTHLAIKGDGYFVIVDPVTAGASAISTGLVVTGTNSQIYLTRDGEFHTNGQGYLVNSDGYFVVAVNTITGANPPNLGTGTLRLVYNNVDQSTLAGGTGADAVRLTDFIDNTFSSTTSSANGAAFTTAMAAANATSTIKVDRGEQNLKFSKYGSTVYDFGYTASGTIPASSIMFTRATPADNQIIGKSLESSNASMTQSVPELSLAQKLFSALTKVIQIHQTNTDAVINLIR